MDFKKIINFMKINKDRKVETFIIAEIGNNHNGSFERAIKMIDKAVEMGADCAKFQMRHMDDLYRSESLKKSGEDLGTEYIIDLLNKFELSVEDQKKLSKYCKEKGIIYMCTPWDLKSVDVLETFDLPAYKVASADLTNIPLISRLVETKKELILSTGMSEKEEVKDEKKYNIVYQNDDVVIAFRVKDEEE